MPDRISYEYAVIRFVPKVERQEFINIGVILYCKRKRFLQVRYNLPLDRLKAFAPNADIRLLEKYLNVWDLICRGAPHGGFIATLDLAGRFRWLTASRSTIIQNSPIHPGLCKEPEEEIEKLFQLYVV